MDEMSIKIWLSVRRLGSSKMYFATIALFTIYRVKSWWTLMIEIKCIYHGQMLKYVKLKIAIVLWWFTELILAVNEYGNWNRNIYTLVIIAILLKLRWNKIIKFPKRKIYCDNKDSHENQTEIIEIMFFLNRS